MELLGRPKPRRDHCRTRLQDQRYRRSGLKAETGRRTRLKSVDPLNLGMILSTKWNVWINLRSMVCPISVTTLADWSAATELPAIAIRKA